MHCVHAKSKKEYHYAFKVFNLFCLSYYDYLGCSTERGNGLKNPKYIEMRMNELYPVKKSRPWLPSGKENSKVNHLSDSSFLFTLFKNLGFIIHLSLPQENGVKEQSSNLFNVSLLSNVVAIKRHQLTR